MITKIELFTGELDRALLNRALDDLLYSVTIKGDIYGVAQDIENLITQLKEAI
jgi:hypothetical protein